MSSDKERSQSSSESENMKRQHYAYDNEDKRFRNSDDPSMRYYASVSPPPMGMMNRQGVDNLMHRFPVHRPISPRAHPAEDSDLTDAMVFLNRIKEEYADNLHVYDSFLETMRDFKFEKIDADEVCKAVRILFKEKPYLVRLFEEYLPHHLRNLEHRNPQFDVAAQLADRHKFNQFRGGPGFMGKPPQPMHIPQMPPNTNIHMSRMNHPMPPPPPYINRTMRQSPPPSMMPEQPARYIKHNAEIPSSDPPKQKTVQEFVQMVKKRYINKPIVYRQFLELLQTTKNCFEKVYAQVSHLLADSPDLIDKFEKIFKNAPSNNEPVFFSELDPLKKIKATLASQGNLDSFLKILNFYNQNYISASDLVSLVQPLIDDNESMNAFKSFIKYQDITSSTEPNKYKGLEKFGSYKILPTRLRSTPNGSSIAREVINFTCVSVSTLESEDENYVFRNKNFSEDLISKIVDERSDADLVLDRLKFLIIKLEELYGSITDGQLDLDDIQMSSALVKETLKKIYDSKSSEVLETIISSPSKSIPVILKRLKKVYKEYLDKMRDYRKQWRSILEENYYKAYDNTGVNFRQLEKNYLSHKFIKSECKMPHIAQITDFSLIEFITELFNIFIQNHSSNGFRKPPVEEQMKVFVSIIDNLKKSDYTSSIDSETFVLYYYLIALYLRFEEIKKIPFEPLSSNPVAVSINYQEEFYIENRFSELVNVSKQLMRKEIDASRYEEYVRKLTESNGFRLYNLKKIMAKIEKQINALIDGVSDEGKDDEIDNDKYNFNINNGLATFTKLPQLEIQ